jgi:hypothetical protein
VVGIGVTGKEETVIVFDVFLVKVPQPGNVVAMKRDLESKFS